MQDIDIIELSKNYPYLAYQALNHSHHHIWWTDLESRVVMANIFTWKDYGFASFEEVCGCTYEDQRNAHPQKVACFREHDRMMLTSKTRLQVLSSTVDPKSGAQRLFFQEKSPAFNKDGALIGGINPGRYLKNSDESLLCFWLGRSKRLMRIFADGSFSIVIGEISA